MSATTIQIVRAGTKEFVDAELHTDVNAGVLAATEAEWGPLRRDLTRNLATSGHPPAQIPRHWHWDWSIKGQHLALLAYRCFGLKCEGKMQGLMMAKVAGRNATLAPDVGKPLVYIDYLESAPWNVVPLVTKPLFSGVGMVLMRAAVQLSVVEGFHGRIGLHALPQSETFYRDKCGMQACGQDPQYQNLPYYEMTRDQAQQFTSN
jgi:hypothetical protein